MHWCEEPSPLQQAATTQRTRSVISNNCSLCLGQDWVPLVTLKFKMQGIDISKELKVLIEVSSARGILIGDIKSSDPYVVVTMGKEKVHTTKYISKT